jgi:predicted nuclease with RNAse H fold
MTQRRVIGVDCASQPKNVGLALCVVGEGRARIEEVAAARTWSEIDEIIADWVASPTLIALDAPLGWPAPLAESLVNHRAGVELSWSANALFRRRTDDVVAEVIGKRPLDVGADRIARTAHSALELLRRLRESLDLTIPLAWTPGAGNAVEAIEVYPAATLVGRGIGARGYKGKELAASDARENIICSLAPEIEMGALELESAVESDHVLDALICVLAGLDYLNGDVIRPNDLELAQREGWIWVKAPDFVDE